MRDRAEERRSGPVGFRTAVPAALAVAGLWLGIGAAPSEAAFTCGYDAAARTVAADLDATGSVASGLVAQEGRIVASQATGVAPCGDATVANVDTVAVRNVTPGGALPADFSLELPTDLAPGATDEPGDSDEIEVTVDLGPGEDGFRLRPGPDSEYSAPSSIALGSGAEGTQANLNAAESTGIDNDLVVRGADFLEIETYEGADEISAAGAEAGAESPYAGPLYVSTSGGDDSITGGSGADNLAAGDGRDAVAGGEGDDWVNGGLGDDALAGFGGNDRIKAADGDDVVRGGAGDDVLRDRRGDDVLSGGPGFDVCRDGDGEVRFRGCEVERG